MVSDGDVEVTLTQDPLDAELDKDSSAGVTFTCRAEGHSLPTKLKFKNSEGDIKDYTGGIDPQITKGDYYISYVHTINPLELTDTSTYTCDGENNNGGVKTGTASKTITVVSDVVVTITVDDTTPNKDSTISITCEGTGGMFSSIMYR